MGEERSSSVLKGGCVWVIHTSNKKSLQKYARVTKTQDGVKVKSMIDLLLLKDILYFVQDVRAVRGMG